MFADDPDSSVTTARFGFGAVFGHVKRGVRVTCREGQMVRQEGIENPVGLGLVNEGKGERGNYEWMQAL